MQARIVEIRIQNFRALENVRLGLSDLTFLVGRNGAGKSSVLDAIEFIRESLTDGLRNALDRRNGLAGIMRRGTPDDASLGVAVILRVEAHADTEIDVLYGFQLKQMNPGSPFPIHHIREALQTQATMNPPGEFVGFERTDQAFITNMQGIAPAVYSEGLALPFVAQANPLWSTIGLALRGMMSYELSPSVIRRSTSIGSSTHLLREGHNAGDVLHYVQLSSNDMDWLRRHLASVLDGFKVAGAFVERGQRIMLFRQEAENYVQDFDASQMSNGTLRALGVLLALCQKPTPSLVLIDEIEDSIHPRALETLIDAAEEKARLFPVVLTTHSPEVLSKQQATPERVRILQWKNGMSRLYPLSAGTRESLDSVTTVGDLLRFNALWPDETPETFHGDILELGE